METLKKALLLAFAAAVPVLAPTFASATETRAGVEPDLQELDEVISYARRLDERIFDRELRFYARYNQLNEADDLDVTCDFVWSDDLWQGFRSMRGRRGCVPVFYMKAQRGSGHFRPFTSDTVGFSGVLGVGVHPGRCSRDRFSRMVASSLDDGSFHDAMYYLQGYAACDLTGYHTNAPDPRLAWSARQDEFRANLVRVISGDAQLQRLAADLNALIDEGGASRDRAAEARHEKWVQVRCVLPPGPRGNKRVGCGR